MTLLSHSTDLQATSPSIAIGLDEVGVTGVVRGIVLGEHAAPATASFDVTASLGAEARGAHMSRFHEAIDHALALVADEGRDVPSLELLAAVVASRAAELQGAAQGRATVRATIASPRVAPASGRRSIDPFDAWATVLADRSASTPRMQVTLGVSAVGMTACPCAQNLVRDKARAELIAAGQLSTDMVDHILDELPIATHNQRSTGVLEVTVPGDGAVTALADPLELATLVRGSMSAQVHELLKRDDELAVVEAAHADPRFVEDCVRSLVRDVLLDPTFAELPPQASITVRQVNHESIHAHDVVATRAGTVAQLRRELELD